MIDQLRNLLCLSLVLFGSGCASTLLYDSVTADRLASLGSETLSLYDLFEQAPVEEMRVEMIRTRLRAIYDYETSKGEKNKGTIRRIEALQLLFERHVAHREIQKWTKAVSDKAKTEIADLISELVKLEERKPRSP